MKPALSPPSLRHIARRSRWLNLRKGFVSWKRGVNDLFDSSSHRKIGGTQYASGQTYDLGGRIRERRAGDSAASGGRRVKRCGVHNRFLVAKGEGSMTIEVERLKALT